MCPNLKMLQQNRNLQLDQGTWSEISPLPLRTRKRGGSPSPRSCRRGPETQVLDVKGPNTSAKIQEVQQPQPTSSLSLSP